MRFDTELMVGLLPRLLSREGLSRTPGSSGDNWLAPWPLRNAEFVAQFPVPIVQHSEQGLMVCESQQSGRDRRLVCCFGQGLPDERFFALKDRAAEISGLRRLVGVGVNN